MNSIDLVTICIVAFVGVFLLLSILAIIMRLITAAFPGIKAGTDEAALAAIATTYKMHYPGTIITRVEEEL